MAQTVISLTSFKGGVGKSTLAVNLAGALALNASTTLIDEDPLQSCYQWAHRNGRLPMPVVIPRELEGTDLRASRYLLVDTEGRPKLEDLSELVITKAPPVGTVGQQARDALREAGIPLANSVVRSYVAHQRAAELGVLVKDVPDPRASQAWADVLELAMEVVVG
jgi:chromosome partitioning protein